MDKACVRYRSNIYETPENYHSTQTGQAERIITVFFIDSGKPFIKNSNLQQSALSVLSVWQYLGVPGGNQRRVLLLSPVGFSDHLLYHIPHLVWEHGKMIELSGSLQPLSSVNGDHLSVYIGRVV